MLDVLQTDSGMYGAIGLVVGVLLLAAAWESRGHGPIPARPTRWGLVIPLVLVGLATTAAGGYVFKTRALDAKDDQVIRDPNLGKSIPPPPDAKSDLGQPIALAGGGGPPPKGDAKGKGKGDRPAGTGKERPEGTGKK